MISVETLRFRYRPDGEVIIDGLSHQFMEGTVTVITGPSGCGKSTLLYLMGLMVTPTDGHIVWDGVRVSLFNDTQRSWLRALRIGFVFQDSVLDDSRTVLDNIAEAGLYAGMSRNASAARAHELMTRFSVQLRADHKPGAISGGQAQRVALCRALMKEPTLLLADEPTGNLDAAATDVVWSALVETAVLRNATVIVATHDPLLASRAHNVLSLEAAH